MAEHGRLVRHFWEHTLHDVVISSGHEKSQEASLDTAGIVTQSRRTILSQQLHAHHSRKYCTHLTKDQLKTLD